MSILLTLIFTILTLFLLKSCLQEINYLTSVPSKLPLTNALSPRSTNERSSSIRRAPPPPAANTNSPVLASRNTNKSPKRNNATVKKDAQVPVNVDEVAMINNIKEETERYNASSSQDDSLVKTHTHTQIKVQPLTFS